MVKPGRCDAPFNPCDSRERPESEAPTGRFAHKVSDIPVAERLSGMRNTRWINPPLRRAYFEPTPDPMASRGLVAVGRPGARLVDVIETMTGYAATIANVLDNGTIPCSRAWDIAAAFGVTPSEVRLLDSTAWRFRLPVPPEQRGFPLGF